MDSDDALKTITAIIFVVLALATLYAIYYVSSAWLAWIQEAWPPVALDFQWILNAIGGPGIVVALLCILILLLRWCKSMFQG